MDTYVFSQAILLKGQIYIFSITTLKFQVSRKLPPMKIAPQSGPGFDLGLALELGLGGGQFSSGAIFLEPKFYY